MFDNLWRTIGFGTPVTVNQMLGRAGVCIFMCIAMISAGLTTNIWDWIIITVLAFGGGMWIGKILGWVNDQLLVQATENLKDILKPITIQNSLLDPTVDYVVNPGEPCWATVGNYSVRIMQRDGGGASVQVFHLNREDEMPINSFEG